MLALRTARVCYTPVVPGAIYQAVLGIDEAGLGPLLGPLCVGYCSFTLPAPVTAGAILSLDLWQPLGIGRTAKERKQRPVVCDSKKLYSSSRGVKPLEEEILGWAALAGHEPAGFNPFMAAFCPYTRGRPGALPWYESPLDPFPLAADAARSRLRAQPVAHALEREGLSLESIGTSPLIAPELNALISRTGNKSRAEFDLICEIIAKAWTRHHRLAVLCDRQGGRERYGRALSAQFPEAEVKAFVESPPISSYELTVPGVDDDPRLFIAFIEKGENDHLPIALASMAAKYVRELMMRQMNDWFLSHDPKLKPTAGYYQDATRFLKETAELRKRLKLNDAHLIRAK